MFYKPADSVIWLLLVLGLDAEDVVVNVNLKLIRPEVVRVQADLETFLVVLHLDNLEAKMTLNLTLFDIVLQ